MKPPILVACLTLTALAPVFGQVQVDYFEEFAREPVPVVNRSIGVTSEQKLWLVGEDQGDLLLRVTPARPEGEIGFPKDSEGLLLQVLLPEETYEGVTKIAQGKLEEGIMLMRPTMYPLIQYLNLPTSAINIHPTVERFVYALVNTPGHENEANEVIRRIPLTEVPPEFTVHALTLVTRLVEVGDKESALRLLNRIPMDEENQRMLDLVMSFADRMRQENNLDEALFLYDRIQQAEGTEAATLATLWSAYCNVEQNRLQMAEIFVDEAGDFGPEDRAYSLARLVNAKVQLKDQDFTDAMKEAAQGVVAADVGYNWMPELTFTVGECYENLEQPDTAREVFNEVILFYPDSAWAEAAKESLGRLPPPAPTEEPEA